MSRHWKSYRQRPCLSPLYQIPRNRNHADRGQEGVIGNVDKELAGGAVFVSGTRHRDGATRVAQAVIGFILIGGFGFLLHLLGETAALNHKAGNDAVKGSVVIKPLFT